MKDILEYAKTDEMPYVYFNAKEGIFKIEGVSTTQDDELFYAFYSPILDFLDGYKQKALPKSTFYFDLEYLDDRSYGFYFDIFGKIYELKELTTISIIWYFENDEQGDTGSEFSEHFFDLPIKFVEK